MSDHTPEPWDEETALRIFPGDWRIKLGVQPPLVDCRVLSEPNYQRAVVCVNALANVSNPDGIQAVIEIAWALVLNGDRERGSVLTRQLASALESAGAKVAE